MDIPDTPMWRVHPAIGMRRVDADELRSDLAPDDLPDRWNRLADEERDDIEEDWTRRLLLAAADRGRAELLLNTSDRLGVNELLALEECRRGDRPYPFRCEVTEEVAVAALGTNVGTGYVLVDDELFLLINDSWSDLFLCVSDEGLESEFGSPERLD